VRPRRQAIIRILKRALERGELHKGTNPERIADLLIGPPFLRLLLPSLPKASAPYAEALLAAIWQGVGPPEPRGTLAGGGDANPVPEGRRVGNVRAPSAARGELRADLAAR